MQDERRQLPSASGMERLALCPGSFALEAKVAPEPDSEYSASGTRIHAALAEFANRSRDPEPGALDEREAKTFQMCAQVYDGIVEQWLNLETPRGSARQLTEQREWCFEGLTPQYSGQYDVLLIEGRRALCLDYKTFHGDQTDAPGNLQLRALAVLVDENHEVDEVAVAIIQPWRTMQPEICVYNQEDLAASRAAILGVLAASREGEASRVPSERACKFCRAKTECPEATAMVAALATVTTREIAIPDLLRLLEIVQAAQKVIDALTDRAKRLLEKNPECLPGWRLKKGSAVRAIADAQAAFTALSHVLTPEEFSACCSVKISQLDAVFRRNTGQKSAAADAALDELLDGIIVLKENKPSLARA